MNNYFSNPGNLSSGKSNSQSALHPAGDLSNVNKQDIKEYLL